ncbi:MAG: CYTH domain-containing protein [Propioniciclava sp.]
MSINRTQEVEQKFEAPVGVSWSFAPVATVGPERRFSLQATYYDTTAFSLVRSGCSLRRREGGSDAGWHLKLPRGSGLGREELQLPLSKELPDQLQAVVTSWTAEPVAPVAVIATDRREYDVFVDGVACALFVADSVATRAGDQTQRWHEFEVELLPGADPALLGVLTQALAHSGVHPAQHGSKIARALGIA